MRCHRIVAKQVRLHTNLPLSLNSLHGTSFLAATSYLRFTSSVIIDEDYSGSICLLLNYADSKAVYVTFTQTGINGLSIVSVIPVHNRESLEQSGDWKIIEQMFNVLEVEKMHYN